MVWGEVGTILDRSIESVRQVHPELEVYVHRMGEGASLLDKSRMLEVTPFDETLFLDADTVVLDRVDHGFEKGVQYGLACCICECPWARSYGGLKQSGDMVEYNTGVIFFTRAAEKVFSAWKRIAPNLDSSMRFRMPDGIHLMPNNDQASFAKAIEETGFNPFVLPLNFNFRPGYQNTFFGPIKIWHERSDPIPGLREWNQEQTGPEAVLHLNAMG